MIRALASELTVVHSFRSGRVCFYGWHARSESLKPSLSFASRPHHGQSIQQKRRNLSGAVCHILPFLLDALAIGEFLSVGNCITSYP